MRIPALFFILVLTLLWSGVSCGQNNIKPGDLNQTASPKLPSKKYLAAEWLFSGNAKDTSGKGNNGVVNGAVLTNDRFGKRNSAYFFQNGSTVNFGDKPSFKMNDQITVSAWIKRVDSEYGRIMGKNDNVNSAGWVLDYGYTGKFLFLVSPGGYLFSVQAYPWNQYYHVAGTYNKTLGIMKLYVDGAVVNSMQFQNGEINFPINLTVGSFMSSGDRYFNGFIDDVRIYDRALSDAEIRALYLENGWSSENNDDETDVAEVKTRAVPVATPNDHRED
jgi:hypothetical protein